MIINSKSQKEYRLLQIKIKFQMKNKLILCLLIEKKGFFKISKKLI